MRIVVQVNPRVEDPRAIAMIARGFLNGVILQNRLLIRAGLVPQLYGSHILYRPEPWAGRFEEFADALVVAERGWGDCDDLVAYRCAEIIEAGGMAKPKVYWRTSCEQCEVSFPRAVPQCPRCGTQTSRHFHGELRIFAKRGSRWVPTDNVEDPSRFLGMHP